MKKPSLFYRQKKAQSDYTADMLPATRKGIFFDVVKLHPWMLIRLGLLLLAFSLPIHLLALFEKIYVAQLYESVGEVTGQALAEITAQRVMFNNLRAAINIPLLMLFSVGFAGVSRVMRQYAWEENMNFRHDFSLGVKQNWKQMLLLSLFVGVFNFLCVFVSNTSYTATNELITYVVYLPYAFCLLIAPAGALTSACIPVYSNSFWQNLKAGFALYSKCFFQTILASICAGVLFVTFVIPNFYVAMVGRLIATIAIPFSMLGFDLFAYNMMDKHINATQFPNLVGKGMYSAAEFDDEDDF